MSDAIYTDSVLLAALEHARGDDRTVLIGALGSARGGGGVEALVRFASPTSGEDGHTRAVAIHGVGERVGSAETLLYASALSDRSVPVQLAAIGVLARCGDHGAASEVFSWLRRKLQRKSRSGNCDPCEVPCAIRFADRNGLLSEVAEVLVAWFIYLQEEERAWLREVWPEVATGVLPVNGQFGEPDRARLAQPMLDEHHMEADPEMWEGFVRESLSRAQRRAARLNG